MREQVFSTRHRQQHAASSTVSYSGTTAGRSMARGLFFPYGLRPENSRRRRSYSFSAKKIGRKHESGSYRATGPPAAYLAPRPRFISTTSAPESSTATNSSVRQAAGAPSTLETKRSDTKMREAESEDESGRRILPPDPESASRNNTCVCALRLRYQFLAALRDRVAAGRAGVEPFALLYASLPATSVPIPYYGSDSGVSEHPMIREEEKGDKKEDPAAAAAPPGLHCAHPARNGRLSIRCGRVVLLSFFCPYDLSTVPPPATLRGSYLSSASKLSPLPHTHLTSSPYKT
ncbi:hypothetical protein MTO96_032595 [Rhipicephalus appendiculatus]